MNVLRARRFAKTFVCRAGGHTITRDSPSQPWGVAGMAKASKLVAAKRGRVLLVRRRRDRRWMFPGGRKRQNEKAKACLRREIREELPKLKLGRLRLWKQVRSKNRHSGRRMDDAIFIAKGASGRL